MITTVAVFCGSSPGRDGRYADAVDELAVELVKRDLHVVYGGARVGAMGQLAGTVLREGGTITGVIPRQLFDYEIGHEGLQELHVVDSMHERKARIAASADAFVALPGGFGTLEEVIEMLTWVQLGIHQHPVGFLNVHGFYDQLFAFFDHAVREHFLREQNRASALCSDDPSALLDLLQGWKGSCVSKWQDEDGSPLEIGK